jgi:glc operon protein GlcG
MSDKKTAILPGAQQDIGAGLVEGPLKKGYNVVATSLNVSQSRVVAFAILGAVLLIGGSICAQQPTATNPLETVPDKMPFDVPYGTPISLERAQAAINTAVAEAKKRDWKMNVAVVDSGGNLVAFQRMDGAQLASIQIAEHKARTAATFRRETKAFENAIQLNNFNYLLTLDGVIASRGGIPLVGQGKLIGAIGCSGGTGSQDEVVCKVGAAVIQ